MSGPFATLAPGVLRSLADALESGSLRPPFNELSVRRFVPGDDRHAIVVELARLDNMSPAHLAYWFRVLASERDEGRRKSERVELVWTGPDLPGSASRDTGVVVRELFATATKSVLVAGYAIWDGKHVFETLATRMDANADLAVRMFLNIGRDEGDHRSDSEIVRTFGERFAKHDWSGKRFPEVFYDPRALSPDRATRAVLHVKCVIVDDVRAFLGSANFTEAAQVRNLEAGVLIQDSAFATDLRGQFDALVSAGAVRRVPGLS